MAKILVSCVVFVAMCFVGDAVKIQGPRGYYQQPQYYDVQPKYYDAQPKYYDLEPKKPLREHEKPQDLNKIPGIPGVDYPIYHEVPHTNFHCGNVPVHPGMYANVETGCQAYHTCHDGREGDQGASFLCTNGTLFNQEIFACDWWYNVDCAQAPSLYRLNADPEKNPFTPKKKPEPVEEVRGHAYSDYY